MHVTQIPLEIEPIIKETIQTIDFAVNNLTHTDTVKWQVRDEFGVKRLNQTSQLLFIHTFQQMITPCQTPYTGAV
jgi:hypothetical protein